MKTSKEILEYLEKEIDVHKRRQEQISNMMDDDMGHDRYYAEWMQQGLLKNQLIELYYWIQDNEENDDP